MRRSLRARQYNPILPYILPYFNPYYRNKSILYGDYSHRFDSCITRHFTADVK